jgi:hypothetical protein
VEAWKGNKGKCGNAPVSDNSKNLRAILSKRTENFLQTLLSSWQMVKKTNNGEKVQRRGIG